MAGTLGRVTAAMATIHTENSNALVNNNFDFTLVKLEVPAEFSELGATISRKRKTDAEEGSLHKTARKLGALFASILPQTDDLFRAYGRRVSEISSMPSINPRDGSNKDGIFASHVGADTASIWAAATSGTAAISVHLLGCMLARIFPGPEAISIWVELVQRQKERIRRKQPNELYSHEHVAEQSAAQQEISRVELANWDASARAWLQSADQAKGSQQKQAMLILNNASIPVNHELETFASVTKAWIAALEAMNSLVKGVPQRVQDGVALLAISSWHLYPDMIVFGYSRVDVPMKDPIFVPSAPLTLGLEHVRDEPRSVYWSLPLACLQYYGHPVQASRAVNQENSRITYQQFSYILLGCVFAGWKEYAATNEDGIRWLKLLGELVNLYGDQPRSGQNTAWFTNLFIAARDLIYCEESEKKAASQLINLGRRRSTFLHPPSESPPPLFGLSHLSILIPLLRNDECRIKLLRRISRPFELSKPQYLIRYQSTNQRRIEYASLVPVHRPPSKCIRDGEMKRISEPSSILIRWISMTHFQLSVYVQRSEDFKDLAQVMKEIDELEAVGAAQMDQGFVSGWKDTIPRESHRRQHELQKLQLLKAIFERRQSIEALGELCLPVAALDVDPRYGFQKKGLLFSAASDFMTACQDILHQLSAGMPPTTSSQTFVAGDLDLAAFFSVTINPGYPIENCSSKLSLHATYLDGLFMAENFDLERLYDYFCPYSNLDPALHTNPAPYFSVQKEIASLSACAMMADIYKLLPGATISTVVVSQFLNRAKWVPGQNLPARERSVTSPLTLAEAFACVAMFESGTCNLDPDTLSEAFAMSSGNSLYVAGSLLCDPHEEPGPSEIRRVVGNIGRAGITFLISPTEVKEREPDPEKWRAINHNTFDGKLEDYFQQTSVHLSFTKYEISLVTEDNPRHIIDRAVVLVETLVSVYDGGTWVAEIDILQAFRSGIRRVRKSVNERHPSKEIYEESLREHPQLAATSIENWDELIEAPSTGAIAIRAHGNWLARLATMAICVKHEFTPVILADETCWTCCAETILQQEKDRVALIC